MFSDSIGELEDLQVTSSEPITNPGSSRSYTTSRSLVCRASSSSHDSNDSSSGYDTQWRSFFLRLSHRNPARSEKPQYELVRVQGHLRVPKISTSEAQKKSRKNKGKLDWALDGMRESKYMYAWITNSLMDSSLLPTVR